MKWHRIRLKSFIALKLSSWRLCNSTLRRAVWPDLLKFRHFGKNEIWPFLRFTQYLGKILCYWANFLWCNGKISTKSFGHLVTLFASENKMLERAQFLQISAAIFLIRNHAIICALAQLAEQSPLASEVSSSNRVIGNVIEQLFSLLHWLNIKQQYIVRDCPC